MTLISLPGLAIGGLWAFMKAGGAEVDICTDPGGGCTSGWYYAGPILLASLLVGGSGVALVAGGRKALTVVLAAVPLLVTLVLVATAMAEDLYYQDGRSYWDAHSGDGVQPLVVFAAIVNLGSAAALLDSARRTRPQMVLAGAALAVAGFALGVLALFALRTGH